METTAKEHEGFNGVIRPLQEEDIPALRQISEHWLQDFNVIAHDEVEGDMATLRESLREGSDKKMFVAQTADGKVVGMMGVKLHPKQELIPFAETDDPSELIVAYVHSDFRKGQGVGTALITASQEFARAQGKKEILLESGPRNIQTGYPFYDRRPGFQRVGKINDFYGPGLDTVVWQKTFE